MVERGCLYRPLYTTVALREKRLQVRQPPMCEIAKTLLPLWARITRQPLISRIPRNWGNIFDPKPETLNPIHTRRKARSDLGFVALPKA